eukprot:15105394-Heterocapsa_arctica.AAC.1
MVWARAATHHQGAGLDKGALLCSVTKVVRSFEKSAVPGLAGMALCVAAGGFWGESRRFLAGYRPDPICRRCFNDDDSDLHM